MRELQPDDLNVESLRRFGISNREMRLRTSACDQFTPAPVRAQLLRNCHYPRAYSSCGPDHRNRERSDFLRHQVTASHYCPAVWAPSKQVSRSADRSGADRTLDRAGAAQE